MNTHKTAQASLDMLVAYGVALLIVAVSLYVVFQLGIFNTRLAPTYCDAIPSFQCAAAVIHPSGNLTLVFSHDIPGSINVNGIACSTEANSTGSGPEYGNVHVTKNQGFYPTNQLASNYVVYPTNQTRVSVYCYNSKGIAKSGIGQVYTGYVWINYSIGTLLPSNNIQEVFSLSAKYS